MTPEQFCYWLQGRAELRPMDTPTLEEWEQIRAHLALVFYKVTPDTTKQNDLAEWVRRFNDIKPSDFPWPPKVIC